MSNIDVVQRGSTLVDLHRSGEIVVLPTVWDAWSAKLAVDAGFHGLTVGSHPVADAIGSADGEQMDLADYLRQVRLIAESVDVPVSADVESGYGLSAADLIGRVIDAGAVGVNIEDTVHSENGRVRELAEHADYIGAAVAAAEQAGVPFVVNGRTDALKHGTDVFADPLAEAVARSVAMADAGALSVYPVGLPDAVAVGKLVGAVDVAVNVTADPVKGHPAGDLPTLRSLGVRRVSFGPLWQMALAESAAEMVKHWRKPE